MNVTRNVAVLAIGALLALPVVSGAQAEGWPRVMANGEDFRLDYGPAGSRNIVGGGPTVVTNGGENLDISYLDASRAQQPPAGLVPVVISGGENFEVVWLPAARATDTMFATIGRRPG